MKIIKDEVLIKADFPTVWDVLTNPEKSPEYMYTCAIESDFGIGNPILWRGIHDKVLYVSGKILEFEPEKRMVYSVIDPNVEYEKTDENHLVVSYQLSLQDGQTHLMVTQSGFETAEDGEARYADVVAGGGWSNLVKKIKEIAER